MSNTRRANPGSPLRQNRFASSPEFQSGLLGNLVAKRCEALDSAEDRELIWMLQHRSWEKGGLLQYGLGLRDKFKNRLGSASMRKYKVDPSRNYTPDQVRRIREELGCESAFKLRGEGEFDHEERARRLAALGDDVPSRNSETSHRPVSYPVAAFNEYCLDKSLELGSALEKICLNPACAFDSVPYFHDLRACLLEDMEQAQAANFTHTSLSRTMWSEIEDAHQLGGLVLLHNDSGNGKSFSAQMYCRAHPGRARYVATPSTNDEVTFLREIARAVGCASGLSFKAIQIRERVLQTVINGDLVLVIDSAQWLFPVTDYRYALPNRLNWILTALSEQGVPVVLIADSKMFDAIGLVEARTGWNRSKLINQLSQVVELPAALPKEDVQIVAAALLPDGDKAAQRKLGDYMTIAKGYLHSGQPAAQRARRIATLNNRERVSLADMEEALETYMKPAFNALADGLKRSDSAASKCKAKVRNWRPDTEAQIASKNGRRRNAIVTSSDVGSAPEAVQASPRRHKFSSTETNRRTLSALDLVPA